MHLHHPSLSLSGKRKGKVKFRNAEEARKARELDASWKELQKKWDVDAEWIEHVQRRDDDQCGDIERQQHWGWRGSGESGAGDG